MGFGLLFIGYFVLFLGALSAIALPIAPFTYVIGAGFVAYSLRNLRKENKLFLFSMITACVLILESVVALILSFTIGQSSAYVVFSVAQAVTAFILHTLLLVAIYIIAKQVEVTKFQSRALVNLFVTAVAGIFLLISVFLDAPASNRFFAVGLTACFIFVIFTLGAIFRCYATICYEGDENMQNETTGIAPFDFLNKLLNKAMNKNKNGKGNKK